MYKKIIMLSLSTFVVACSVSPKKFSSEQLINFGHQEVNAFYTMQERPLHTIDIHEVSARVLKYNLTRQLKQMELDLNDARLAEYKNLLLPSLNASVNVQNRSKEVLVKTASTDANGNLTLGTPGSVYQAKDGQTTGLKLSWDALDFSTGYLAEQQSNKVLIARERRRKAIFKLLEDSHTAYWYVVTGQRNERLILSILRNIDKALRKISVVGASNLPKLSLIRQRNLLKNKRKVNGFLRTVRQKKMELADLMGLPADTNYTVYSHNEKLPVINLSREQMDEFLFANHPDMRVAAYDQSNNLLDSKLAFAKLLPSLSLNVGSVTSSDRHLVNQSYATAGGTFAWNLLNIFSFDERSTASEIEAIFAKNLRIASGVSVLTAARIRELLYNDAMARYADDVNLHMIEKQLSKAVLSRKKSSIQSYIDTVEAQLGELESGLARAESYAELTGYALSIASVLNPSDFSYDLNRIDLETLKYSLKLELGRMPVSWIRQNDKYTISSKATKIEVDKIFKLWRIEKYRGVKEGGDSGFKPNRLPSSALGNYAKPMLKPIVEKSRKIKKTIIKSKKKPKIKLMSKPKSTEKPPVVKPIVKENSADTPKDAVSAEMHELLQNLEAMEK